MKLDEAKKLLSNEKLNSALLNSLPYPALLVGRNRKVIAINEVAKEMGVIVNSYCWDTFGKRASISQEDKDFFEKNNSVPDKGIKCTFCKADDCLETGKDFNEKIPAEDIVYDTYWVPLTDEVFLHYAIVL